MGNEIWVPMQGHSRPLNKSPIPLWAHYLICQAQLLDKRTEETLEAPGHPTWAQEGSGPWPRGRC